MTVYADCAFYQREYLSGKAAVIPAEMFLHYARKASGCIRQYTLDNIGDVVPEAVKLCCCELAECLYTADKDKSVHGIVSEKVGDIATSYESSETRKQALSTTVKSTIYSWLADTGLLYRGGRLC